MHKQSELCLLSVHGQAASVLDVIAPLGGAVDQAVEVLTTTVLRSPV